MKNSEIANYYKKISQDQNIFEYKEEKNKIGFSSEDLDYFFLPFSGGNIFYFTSLRWIGQSDKKESNEQEVIEYFNYRPYFDIKTLLKATSYHFLLQNENIVDKEYSFNMVYNILKKSNYNYCDIEKFIEIMYLTNDDFLIEKTNKAIKENNWQKAAAFALYNLYGKIMVKQEFEDLKEKKYFTLEPSIYHSVLYKNIPEPSIIKNKLKLKEHLTITQEKIKKNITTYLNKNKNIISADKNRTASFLTHNRMYFLLNKKERLGKIQDVKNVDLYNKNIFIGNKIRFNVIERIKKEDILKDYFNNFSIECKNYLSSNHLCYEMVIKKVSNEQEASEVLNQLFVLFDTIDSLYKKDSKKSKQKEMVIKNIFKNFFYKYNNNYYSNEQSKKFFLIALEKFIKEEKKLNKKYIFEYAFNLYKKSKLTDSQNILLTFLEKNLLDNNIKNNHKNNQTKFKI